MLSRVLLSKVPEEPLPPTDRDPLPPTDRSKKTPRLEIQIPESPTNSDRS